VTSLSSENFLGMRYFLKNKNKKEREIEFGKWK
jgi:hypothetical protein